MVAYSKVRGLGIKQDFLEIGLILKNHPILKEKKSYRVKYVSALEYFIHKYSENDIWAKALLDLYIEKLLDGEYTYIDNFAEYSGQVFATKARPFKFFSYRYCFIFDCVYMNALWNEEKRGRIFDELLKIYHKRYEKKLRTVFDFFYNQNTRLDRIDQINYMKECWSKNQEFQEMDPIKILVTANMSAGKSTLLNALIGKKINKTQNAACTAKIHYIVNKPFEDSFCFKWDYELNLNAKYRELMEDNINNNENEIAVGTYFRSVEQSPKRIWLIDTPGVNSVENDTHQKIAEDAIQTIEADILIHLLNGTNIGTEDDRKYLQFIFDHYKGKILFVVNKMDKFKKREDSIEETVNKAIDELKQIGFKNPIVVPASAYAAFLAKKDIFGVRIDEDEQDELEVLAKKFQNQEFWFDRYYSGSTCSQILVPGKEKSSLVLFHSGIPQIEKIIYHLKGQE